MRKLLLSLATLLFGAGAWGQTATLEPSVTVASPEHQYLLMNLSKSKMAMGKTTAPVSNTTNPGRFAFFTAKEGSESYLIYSVDEEKWLTYDPSDLGNGKGKATLVSDQKDAKPWKAVVNSNNSINCYQFSPYNNNDEVAGTYMNWYQGENGNPNEGEENANTVGLYTDNANMDAGSAWVLTPFPTQKNVYILQDIVSGRCVNLYEPFGVEANSPAHNLLATISSTAKPLYISPSNSNAWQWSIHTKDNYLNQYTDRKWNTKVSNDETAQNFLWHAEIERLDNGNFCFLLYGNENRYIGADANSQDGSPLYVDPKNQDKYLRFQLKTPSLVWQTNKISNNCISTDTKVVIHGVGGRPGWAYKGSATTTTLDAESGESTTTTTYNMYLRDNMTQSELTDEFIFTMVSTGIDGSFKLQAHDGTFFNGGSSFTDDEANAKVFKLKAKPNANAGIWNIAYDNTYLNMDTSSDAMSPVTSNYITTGWSDENDANGKWEIYTINNPDISELTLRLSDNYNNTYDIRYIGIPGTSMPPTLTGTEALTVNIGEDWNQKQLNGTITFPFYVSNENDIRTTMISSFQGNAFKWYADGTSVKAEKNQKANSENIMNYLWAIYPSFSNGALTFSIKNMGTEKYIHSISNTNAHSEGTVTLSEEASVLTFENGNQFKLSTGKYLSLNSSSDGKGIQFIGTWDSHNGTKNAFPTSSYDLTIGDIKAATLYTPFAVTIPENVKAKYITAEGNSDAVNSGILKYTAIESTIPANTAVVVLGEAGTYTFNAATEEGTEVNGNLLFGYAKATPVADHEGTGTDGTVYALHATRGAFGHFTGTTYRAGKAYLDVTSLGENAGRISFFSIFDEDIETGIENIQGNEESGNGIAYDLSGRRVQATAKGLYIINGKKVIK